MIGSRLKSSVIRGPNGSSVFCGESSVERISSSLGGGAQRLSCLRGEHSSITVSQSGAKDGLDRISAVVLSTPGMWLGWSAPGNCENNTSAVNRRDKRLVSVDA